MKRFIEIICVFSIVLSMVACGNVSSPSNNKITVSNYAEDNIENITKFVVNSSHFSSYENVKVNYNIAFNDILKMELEDYSAKIAKAVNITYPRGEINIFYLNDAEEMERIMIKTINLAGSTINTVSKVYDSKYMVITSGNYLIVALVNIEESNETQELVEMFNGFFGKENYENIYELLLKSSETKDKTI